MAQQSGPGTVETEPTIVVAIREWWNPRGCMMTSARGFDPATGRVAVVFPDTHGRWTAAAAVADALGVSRSAARFVFDVVRVGRKSDLHADPMRSGLDRVSTFTGAGES